MRALKIIGGFVLGLVIGEAIPIIWYIVATSYFGMFDRDGGGAMAAIFIMGPLLALILGIGFSIFVGMRTRTKAV